MKRTRWTARMSADDPSRAELSARGFTTSITALLVLLVVAAVPQLPSSLVGSGLADQRNTYQLLWPQRWSYFTAEGAVAVGAYRLGRDGRTYESAIQPLTSARNLGGLSRREYATILVAATLAGSIPAERWRTCGRPSLATCAGELAEAPVTRVGDRSPGPPFCGTVVFTRERSVADAWQVESVAR